MPLTSVFTSLLPSTFGRGLAVPELIFIPPGPFSVPQLLMQLSLAIVSELVAIKPTTVVISSTQ